MWSWRADRIIRTGVVAPFPIALYRPELIPGMFRKAYMPQRSPMVSMQDIADTAGAVARAFVNGQGARFTIPGTNQVAAAVPGMNGAGMGLAGVIIDAANMAARGEPAVIRDHSGAAVVEAIRGTNRTGRRF